MGFSLGGTGDATGGIQMYLKKSSNNLNKSYHKLSSGNRIVTASDDAAGLAVAEALKNQSKLASVAIRNANDGISITSLADAAMSQIGDLLSRMSELAEQSSNGVYSDDQRSALQLEFDALRSEVGRISNSTKFNDVAVLSTSDAWTFQVGLDESSDSQITMSAVQVTQATLSISASTFKIDTAANARNALSTVSQAISTLAQKRGAVGAAESRLNSAVNYLSVARENYAAAESAIRDVDVADEVARMVRNNTLQNMGTAMMAQANQQPDRVMRLLGYS